MKYLLSFILLISLGGYSQIVVTNSTHHHEVLTSNPPQARCNIVGCEWAKNFNNRIMREQMAILSIDYPVKPKINLPPGLKAVVNDDGSITVLVDDRYELRAKTNFFTPAIGEIIIPGRGQSISFNY